MKVFNRASLPNQVKYNKRVYYYAGHKAHIRPLPGQHAIQVNVIARPLRGRTELHGRPYKPTEWIYIAH